MTRFLAIPASIQFPAMHGISSTAIGVNNNDVPSSPAVMDLVAVSSHKPPPNSEIQRLSQDTIRRISAEQAISDLASIVKELIDNALDAEATTVKSK
jgi:hypothetical protein